MNDSNIRDIADKLIAEKTLSFDGFLALIENREHVKEYIRAKAQNAADKRFNKQIYIRGLIEISNYCKSDCYYCGISRSNTALKRYRLSKDEILSCCASGYELGFRTFVLQGGEDAFYTDDVMIGIIKAIRAAYADCAITLSIGEHSRETYQKYFDAGANRYLLRHETANEEHYQMLHPDNQSATTRKQCLYDLKDIGFQVGTGFMVGSPYQTLKHIAEDLLFIHALQPQMVGIGPFIPHHSTRFAGFSSQGVELTLFLVSIIRLMLPNALIPATTAVGTLDPNGREHAIQHGANVLMPNLSPIGVRKQYELYDNKISTGEEAAEYRTCLDDRLSRIGYRTVCDRGDYKESPLFEK